MSRRHGWEPLYRCNTLKVNPAVENGADIVAAFQAGEFEIWRNHLYLVHVWRGQPHPGYDDGVTHLSIRRLDRRAVHDWRHFQRIKNELCGPEWEGLELYPAESRLNDEANQYHLYVVNGPTPFGSWEGRLVSGPEEAAKIGAVQRQLDAPLVPGT